MNTLREALRPTRWWIISVEGLPVKGNIQGSTPMFSDPASAGQEADRVRGEYRRAGKNMQVKVEPVMVIGRPTATRQVA